MISDLDFRDLPCSRGGEAFYAILTSEWIVGQARSLASRLDRQATRFPTFYQPITLRFSRLPRGQ